MTTSTSAPSLDLGTRLAVYRTRLAEMRTAVSELQLGILLVTLPLTAHLTLMLLAERHPLAAQLLALWPLSGAILLVGLVLVIHAVSELVRVGRRIRALRRELRGVM
ncbi:MAG: hypothetical protein HY901_31600 [Deltaproteobacteria bacterium]|nr:hypothetical protein [Deltaproteobacteria bacterium]